MVVTFFGHSDYVGNLEDEEYLFNLIKEVGKYRDIDFYLGGYGGFDNFAFRCAKKYKEEKPDSKLIFVTPYLGKWLNDRKEVLELNYDSILYPELECVPKKLAILKRNEWMIDHADYVFYYVGRHYGGAYKALQYAYRRKKSYKNIFKGEYELY